MKSKTQIVTHITLTALIGASGIASEGQQTLGRQASRTDRLPISAPQDIIGPVCPSPEPCVE